MQSLRDFTAEWCQPGYGYSQMAAMCLVLRKLMSWVAVALSVAWIVGVGDIGLRNVVVLWLYPVGSHLAAWLLVALAHREIDAAEGR